MKKGKSGSSQKRMQAQHGVANCLTLLHFIESFLVKSVANFQI